MWSKGIQLRGGRLTLILFVMELKTCLKKTKFVPSYIFWKTTNKKILNLFEPQIRVTDTRASRSSFLRIVKVEIWDKSRKVRSERGDWSLISNPSLWPWKTNTKCLCPRAAFDMLQPGPRSPATRPPLKADTSKVASVHLHLPPRRQSGTQRTSCSAPLITPDLWKPRNCCVSTV